ncbi:MAG: glycosyltransferase [Deltaproteobacteria bacterium]|nr:glycosyltransferase [Deltaproteobacteria bacterium]
MKSPMILYQGQISGANYAHLLLEAASIVLKQKPNVSFVVVGGGDGLDRAKELAEKLEINAHVRFTGAVPHREIPRFIEAADICVACFEDNEQARCKSPLKLAEYLASGSAIVANRMGEVSFMLKDSGLIVEDDQPSSFSKAVCYLLDHPDKRKELGQKARRRAEQVINWSKSAENLMGAYRMAFYVRYGLL